MVSEWTGGRVDVENSQSGENEDQTDAHVEDRLQAEGERQVDGGEDTDRAGAPVATSAHMQVESDNDFLGEGVSEVEPWKLSSTYGDDFDDDISNRKVGETAGVVVDGVGTDVDGSNNLGGDLLSALVVPAAAERGEDAVALVAEGVEGVRDVAVGPLRNDFGDGAGEGHDTSSEDSEDGGETHGEEAGDEE